MQPKKLGISNIEADKLIKYAIVLDLWVCSIVFF